MPLSGSEERAKSARFRLQASGAGSPSVEPPAAARVLLAHLPVDCPTDCYISRLVLEGHVTAVVACPQIAEQRDPYAKGDIKHTNKYK